MADKYARLADTVDAHEGKGYITINGSNREMFEISSLKAQLEYTIAAKRMLGKRMTQHKIVGAEGTGSVTMYFNNSDMLKQAIAYLNSGYTPGITLQVYNEDPQSTVGRQEVVLYNCILNTVPVAALDDGSDDPITFDTDFTFDSISALSSFTLPENYR